MKKKLLSVILSLALSVSFLTGTAFAEEKSYEGLEIHLGDQTPFFIIKLANAFGFFEEEFGDDGITVTVDNFKNGTGLVEAFSTKDEDFGVSGMIPIISAIAAGSDLKVVATSKWTQRGFAYVAAKDSGIETLEDLKGKHIGITVGTNTQQVALKLLDSVGITEAEVTFENLSDILTPLINGQIDAAVLTGTNLPHALGEGATLIADCSAGDFMISNNYVVRGEFAEEYPELVSRIIRVLDKTTKYIAENEEEALEKYSELTQAEIEDARYAYEAWDFGVSVDEEHFQKPIEDAYNFLASVDTVESGLDIRNFFDTSYFENAGL